MQKRLLYCELLRDNCPFTFASFSDNNIIDIHIHIHILYIYIYIYIYNKGNTNTYLLNVSIEAEEVENAGAVHLGRVEATHHGNRAGDLARV